MGISVGSQGLTRFVDELFADVKGNFVFNYLDGLVVYSRSVMDHVTHVRLVLQRLQDVRFTLNPAKITIGAREVKYLGHSLSSRGITVLLDRVAAINLLAPELFFLILAHSVYKKLIIQEPNTLEL